MRSARVAAAPADGSVAVRTTSLFGVWSRAVERWEELQVGRQGSYSVERLVSLDHYCKTASRTRVILVCVLTPIPAFTFAVLLECLPLKHPTEGWAANWLFWVRWALTMLAISFVGVSQLVTYVPGLNFTLVKRVVVSVGSTTTFVGMCILGANAMKFPVPYMLQLGSVVMGLCIAAMVRLVFSRKEFANNSPLRPSFRRFYRFLFAYLILGGVYPFYRVVFDFTPVSARGIVILLLPMWKFAAKHLIVKAIRDLEDFIPELVAFTVDFFSALFVSACMTTSGSAYLSAMCIVGDVGQSLLELNEAPPPVSSNKFQHADRSKTLVLQGLQLLFHCEYLALVECVVPLVFATYKSILEQLPNVVYYPGGAGSWGISALANLLVFSALEIMTFVLFVKFLQRKFSFSPLVSWLTLVAATLPTLITKPETRYLRFIACQEYSEENEASDMNSL
ncbi:hypothetical protein PF008_g12893 [Phytophthora fragariae]|uniref:Uncharacterized protein n=1 Tax=Phytophthora fragariae TaxID=53985 RepID=A0A6G0RLL5_9STRA|nr:hypothetical protein PF008_g12893 [Phytophthora fragariae]